MEGNPDLKRVAETLIDQDGTAPPRKKLKLATASADSILHVLRRWAPSYDQG